MIPPPPPLHPQLVGSGYHPLTTRRGFVSSYTIVATSSAAVHLVPHRSWQLLARKHAKFPKAAFKKLTSRAAWHSPGSREAVLSSIATDDGGSVSTTASIAASQALPNAWDVNMSKSLADLNRWLSSAVPADIAEFLAPSMAKDAVGGDVYAVEGDIDAEAVGLTRGQYFASPETAATISGRLEAHLAALPRGAEVALVEPSCGTGALLLGETGALAALTRWSASGGGDVSLVCCVDIDSAVLSYCNSAVSRDYPTLPLSFNLGSFLATDLSLVLPPSSTLVSVCGPPYGTHGDRGLTSRFVSSLLSLSPSLALLILPERLAPLEGLPEGYEAEEVGRADEFVARDGRTVKQPSVIIEVKYKK
eukprot:CAMPEP_0182461168 /NCGR_PEP_ID=MMETSP1319-20130603/5811_1 /TAXON_ID=172717 /ORGANISM="Bolidomonas pacifica, Strain RCC208" /LENGTH=362 /DNA_ID=CAMNT_0024660397 /DNA_START=19 /DNA_END=1107 /DNA_ORIENTATION=+